MIIKNEKLNINENENNIFSNNEKKSHLCELQIIIIKIKNALNSIYLKIV